MVGLGWLVGADAVDSVEKRSVESSEPMMATETSAADHTQPSLLPVGLLTPCRPTSRPTSASLAAESALHHVTVTMPSDAAAAAAAAHSDGNWSGLMPGLVVFETRGIPGVTRESRVKINSIVETSYLGVNLG